MRKGIGVFLLIVAVFLLSISLQFVVAQEDAPSTEIEIVEDNGGTDTVAEPEATQPPSNWQPNTESNNPKPFYNPLDPNSASSVQVAPPSAPPTLPPVAATPVAEDIEEPVGVEVTPTPAVTDTVVNPVMTAPPVPTKTPDPAVIAAYSYTGVLWNGSQHVAIIATEDASFIVKAGDKINNGFVILYVDPKEVILVKEGAKSTLKIQEVE
jgi:hypothetical protein